MFPDRPQKKHSANLSFNVEQKKTLLKLQTVWKKTFLIHFLALLWVFLCSYATVIIPTTNWQKSYLNKMCLRWWKSWHSETPQKQVTHNISDTKGKSSTQGCERGKQIHHKNPMKCIFLRKIRLSFQKLCYYFHYLCFIFLYFKRVSGKLWTMKQGFLC